MHTLRVAQDDMAVHHVWLSSMQSRLSLPLSTGQAGSRGNILDIRWVMTRWRAAVKSELPKPAQIDRVAQDSRSLLRSVEAHGVFRHHEVDHELAFPLVLARLCQLSIGRALRFLRLDVVDQVDQCI